MSHQAELGMRRRTPILRTMLHASFKTHWNLSGTMSQKLGMYQDSEEERARKEVYYNHIEYKKYNTFFKYIFQIT